ncbi:hypothetical protein ACIBFB_24290 [Nocardiopsis sp. NPDC050513]|uniref:hypothetical protein n=1 Tax=Nocardiopsis sp. NPDC050513 TaxID=3364338 RepID=UPI0037A1F0CB
MSELVRRAVLDKRFWPGVAMAALIGGSLSVAGVATADTVDEAPAEGAAPAEAEEGRGGGPLSGRPRHDDNGSGVHSETEDSEFHEVCDGAGAGGAFIGPCPRPGVGGGGGGAVVGEAPEELAVTGPSEDLALVGGAIALTGGVVMYITRRRSERAEDASSEAAV